MHIEPGVVTGAKIILSYATAAGALAWGARLAWQEIRERGLTSVVSRAAIAAGLVFSFFEILPHFRVGVSEVHLILGSSLFLIFGAAPAAIGLALGLLTQSLFFAPADLPQYGMNVTTLLVPLFAMSALARRVIPEKTAYVDLRYGQAMRLSLAFQGGIVSWVGFWALYGHGFSAQNLAQIASFGAAYMSVILIEPLADLAILAVAKTLHRFRNSGLFTTRLHNAA